MLSKLFRKKRRRHGAPIMRNNKHRIGRNRSASSRIKPVRKTNSKTGKYLKLILSTATVIALFYWFFFSAYFKINAITLSVENFDNESIAQEIDQNLQSAIGKSIFFYEPQEAELEILSDFPQLESIEVKKDYPNSLSINFAEYPLVANIVNESPNLKKSYIINSIGYVIKEDFEDPNLPYIHIQSDEPINPENQIIESSKLQYITEVAPYFEDRFGMRIIRLDYKPIPRELHLLTERDFFIWLDIQKEYEEQLRKLKKALVKLDIFTENLEYIDLRIAGNNGDKIIYKRK